jgi:ribose transport system ATP-binding protein
MIHNHSALQPLQEISNLLTRGHFYLALATCIYSLDTRRLRVVLCLGKYSNSKQMNRIDKPSSHVLSERPLPENAKQDYLVEMKGIVKWFPGVLALDHVDFELRPGEVHMLLGENGAGKSTLIKVLSGAYICEDGEILIKGTKVDISSPIDALRRNLRFIYQELNLVDQIDVARNMFLGLEPTRIHELGILNRRKLYSLAGEYLARLNINISPRECVGSLSATQQKMIEIAKALVADISVLVLDEPTDVLEDRARQELFDIIRKLKKEQNIGFIYISHRYAEVHELGDRVTILRDGRKIGTYSVPDISLDEIIEKMTGAKVGNQYLPATMPKAEEALRVSHIVKEPFLNNISLCVHKGELVAVTGLMGAGKTELARVIAGIDRPSSGTIFIDGKLVYNVSPAAGIRNGIAYVTENRKTEGLILKHTIERNYALPNINRLSRLGLVKYTEMGAEIDSLMVKLRIKARNRDVLTGQLSGGNQQKVVLAKWLGTVCKVLLIDEPTRGIDIKGRADVYRILEDLLEEDVSIVMFTSDYQEALQMGHRVIVLHRGAICGEFARGDATEEDILRVAIGERKCATL